MAISPRERAIGTARWFWGIPAVTIRSELPPAEAIQRIGWSFDAPLGEFMLFARRGRVLGRIEGTHFKMVIRWIATADYARASYPRPYCNGEVVPDGDGSLIAWDFDMTATRVFFSFWFAFVGLIFLPASVAVTLTDPGQVAFLLMVLGMMLVGLLGFWWTRSEQDRDAREIRGILEGAVEADRPG